MILYCKTIQVVDKKWRFYFYALVSMVPNYQTIHAKWVVLFLLILCMEIFLGQKNHRPHFFATDHETNKIHILLHVTVHETPKKRIDRRHRQIWSLSSRSNNRSIDNFVVDSQSVSRRSLQSQQRKPVYFWYSGRSVGSRHTPTLFTIEGFVHTGLHVQAFLYLLDDCDCKKWDGHLCTGGCPQFGSSDGGCKNIFLKKSVHQK